MSASSVLAILGVVHEKRGETEGCVIGLKRCCHRHCEGFLLLGEGKKFPWAGRNFGASDDDDTDDSGVIYFCRSGAIY